MKKEENKGLEIPPKHITRSTKQTGVPVHPNTAREQTSQSFTKQVMRLTHVMLWQAKSHPALIPSSQTATNQQHLNLWNMVGRKDQ